MSRTRRNKEGPKRKERDDDDGEEIVQSGAKTSKPSQQFVEEISTHSVSGQSVTNTDEHAHLSDKNKASQGEEADADLKTLLEKLSRPPEVLLPILLQNGITNVDELIGNKAELEKHQLINITKSIQKTLFLFCKWHEKFYTKNASDIPWQLHFDEDSLDDIESVPLRTLRDPDILMIYAIDVLHEKELPSLEGLSDAEYERMYEFTADKVIRALPEELIKACQFPLRDNAVKWIKAIFNLPSGDPYPFPSLGTGKTQSGKSAAKAVLCAICEVLRLKLFIITKGVQESRDLAKKIRSKLAESKHRRCQSLDDGVLTVVADTGSQIEKLVRYTKEQRQKNPGFKFVVVADECDAHIRTEDGSQYMERSYNALMALGPCLRVEISATFLLTLLYFTFVKVVAVDQFEIGTSEDYSGVEEIKAFEYKGRPVFLPDVGNRKARKTFCVGIPCATSSQFESNLEPVDTKPVFDDDKYIKFDFEELKKFCLCQDLEFIPHTSEPVMQLYLQAVSRKDKRGVLLLDGTNPRVKVNGNVFEKACAVQNHLREHHDKDTVIVVNVGNGIYIRRPDYLMGRKVSKERTVSEVLEQLDKEFGLCMPIFVFGYFKMQRVISYRSRRRVPTHGVLFLGKGYSIASYIQALGRLTFNGLETLKANGHDSVTVLTSEADMKTAKHYYNFVQEYIRRRIKEDQTAEEALSGASGKYPTNTDFCSANRKLGRPEKSFLDVHIGDELFEDDLEDDFDDEASEDGFKGDEEKKERYWNDTVSQRVLRAFVDLKEEDRKFSCSERQIMEKFNDTYQDDCVKMNKDTLMRILNDYANTGVLEKIETGSYTLWKVANWEEARFLMNDTLLDRGGVLLLTESGEH